MTPGQIALLVLMCVSVAAILALPFIQGYINARMDRHDRETDARLNKLEAWRKVNEEQDSEDDENPYTWLTKAKRS